MLRAAYLNQSSLAVFEALNIVMNYLPYGIDDSNSAEIDAVPVWLLQALREMAVFSIENETQDKTGAKPKDYMKYLAYIAKSKAENDKNNTNEKFLKYDRAQDHLIEMGEGLQPETIKKYAAEFEKEDRKFDSIGKYFTLTDKDMEIYEAVKEGIE